MSKHALRPIGLGFSSVVLYISAFVVYINRYNSCGGDTCDPVSGGCLTVCVPVGIRYYIPIMFALLLGATALAAICYQNLRNKKIIVYLIVGLLGLLLFIYIRENNLVLKMQNQKYAQSQPYDCGDISKSTFVDRMHEGCLLEVRVKQPYISGDELTAIIAPLEGTITDARDAHTYGLYQVGFPYGKVDRAEKVLRAHPKIEVVKRYTGVIEN